jgi:hypothetical protein
MPLIYTTNSNSSYNLSGSGATIFTHTMSADGHVGVSLWLENLSNGAATLTFYIETLDSSDNSYDSFVEIFSKPTGPTRLRFEFERTAFIRSAYKLRIKVASTGTSNSSVAFTWYVVDPNHASTLDSLPDEVADQVWDEPFGDHFEVSGSMAEYLVTIGQLAGNASANSDEILADTGTTGVKVAASGLNGVTLPAGIITASSINNGAITNAKFSAGAIDADALAADVVNKIWMGTALTEAYAAQGSTGTPAQLLYMILSACTQFEILEDEIKCNKLDGSTQSMKFLMDSETNPTSRARTQ